jgi:hypothetical protein
MFTILGTRAKEGKGKVGSDQSNGIAAERGGELWRMYPEKLTIIGLDISEEDLLARFPGDGRVDENARAAIASCRDETRIGGPPAWFKNRLAMSEGLPAVECFKLPPDTRGKIWVIVFKGRNRTLGQREINSGLKKAERQQVDIKLLPLRGEKKLSRQAALIAQAGSNSFIVPSLQTRAAYALEMQEERVGMDVIVTMLTTRNANSPEEMAEGESEIRQLLQWAEIFPLLGEEATRQANAGALKLGRARKLAQLRPEQQDEELSRPRKSNRISPLEDTFRPASPARTRALVAELEGDYQRLPAQFSRAEVLTMLRVLGGDAAPELMNREILAAWNRAGERTKARKARK